MNLFEVYVLRKAGVRMNGRIPSRMVIKAMSVNQAATLMVQLYRQMRNLKCIKVLRVFRLQQPKGAGILHLPAPIQMGAFKLVSGKLRQIEK